MSAGKMSRLWSKCACISAISPLAEEAASSRHGTELAENKRNVQQHSVSSSSEDSSLRVVLMEITARLFVILNRCMSESSDTQRKLTDTTKELENKFGQRFLIVHLCGNKSTLVPFEDKVIDLSWPDTVVPSLERLCRLCQVIDSWLTNSDKSVIVFDCRGSPANVAVTLAAFLVYINICDSSNEQFSIKECEQMKTFYEDHCVQYMEPSHRRYVEYFRCLLSSETSVNCQPLYLVDVTVTGLPALLTNDGNFYYVKVYQSLILSYFSQLHEGKSRWRLSSTCCLELRGDVIIKCYRRHTDDSQSLVFKCQFNTCIVQGRALTFTKSQLDVACSDHSFPTNGGLEVTFGKLNDVMNDKVPSDAGATYTPVLLSTVRSKSQQCPSSSSVSFQLQSPPSKPPRLLLRRTTSVTNSQLPAVSVSSADADLSTIVTYEQQQQQHPQQTSVLTSLSSDSGISSLLSPAEQSSSIKPPVETGSVDTVRRKQVATPQQQRQTHSLQLQSVEQPIINQQQFLPLKGQPLLLTRNTATTTIVPNRFYNGKIVGQTLTSSDNMAMYASVAKRQMTSTTTPSASSQTGERELDKILDELLRDSIFAPPSLSSASSPIPASFSASASPRVPQRHSPASPSTSWNARADRELRVGGHLSAYEGGHGLSSSSAISPPVPPPRRSHPTSNSYSQSASSAMGSRWDGQHAGGYFSDSEQMTSAWLQKQSMRLGDRRDANGTRGPQQQNLRQDADKMHEFMSKLSSGNTTANAMAKHQRRSHSTSRMYDAADAATADWLTESLMLGSLDNVSELMDKYEFRPVMDNRFHQGHRTEKSYFVAGLDKFGTGLGPGSGNNSATNTLSPRSRGRDATRSTDPSPAVPQRASSSHEAVERGRSALLQSFQSTSPRPLTRQLSDLSFDRDSRDEAAWLRSLCFPQQQAGHRPRRSPYDDDAGYQTDVPTYRSQAHTHYYNSYNSRTSSHPTNDYGSTQSRRSNSLVPLPGPGQDGYGYEDLDDAISLVPIGAGMQNLEPSQRGSTLKLMTSNDTLHYNAFPTLNSYDKDSYRHDDVTHGKVTCSSPTNSTSTLEASECGSGDSELSVVLRQLDHIQLEPVYVTIPDMEHSTHASALELRAIQSPVPGKMSPVIGAGSGALKSQHSQATSSSAGAHSSYDYGHQSSFMSDDMFDGYQTLSEVAPYARSVSQTHATLPISSSSSSSRFVEPGPAPRRLDSLGYETLPDVHTDISRTVTTTQYTDNVRRQPEVINDNVADLYSKPLKRETMQPVQSAFTPSTPSHQHQQLSTDRQHEQDIHQLASIMQQQLSESTDGQQQQGQQQRGGMQDDGISRTQQLHAQNASSQQQNQQRSQQQQQQQSYEASASQSQRGTLNQSGQIIKSPHLYGSQSQAQALQSHAALIQNLQSKQQLGNGQVQSQVNQSQQYTQPQAIQAQNTLQNQNAQQSNSSLADEDVSRFLLALSACDAAEEKKMTEGSGSGYIASQEQSSSAGQTSTGRPVSAQQSVQSYNQSSSLMHNGVGTMGRNEMYENKVKANGGGGAVVQGHARTLSVDAGSSASFGSHKNFLTVDRHGGEGGGTLSRRSSTSSIASLMDVDWSQQTPKFVHDTSKLWYKPNINRDEITRLLKDKPAGTFIVRDSTTYAGAFGLAVKVDQVPDNVVVKGDDIQSELIRHYLIEPTSKGVRIKGCTNEPTFASLAALIYQHSITNLALPCKLLLADKGEISEDAVDALLAEPQSAAPSGGAASNVLFINSVELESLTGTEAVQKIVAETMKTASSLKTAIVQLKVTPAGVTVTDVQRKLFFRRHFPLSTVTFAGLDPEGRQWKQATEGLAPNAPLKLFGVVAKKHANAPDNVGHVFADIDADQPASAIVMFIQKLLMSQSSGKAFKS